MEKVQVLARSRSDFAGGVDELTFRGTGTLEKTDYGYRLRYTAQNELDGSAVASEMRLETQQRRAVVITESKDGGYGLLLAWRAWRAGLGTQAWLLAALLCVQVALGIANVMLGLPLLVATVHNAGAALLLLTMLWMLACTRRAQLVA